jgi:PAS domain S-box-containing protein
MQMETPSGTSSSSTELAEALLDFGSDLFLLLDAAGVIAYASPSYQAVLGYVPATLLHTSLPDYLHPDDVAQVQASLAGVLAQPGSTSHVIYRHRHADGSWRTIRATLHNHLDIPALHGVVVVGHAPRPSADDLLQQVLDELPEAVVVVDADGRYILNNRASQAIHGDISGRSLPLTDADARAHFGLRRPDGTPYPALELPLQRALLRGEAVYGEQLLARNREGRDAPLLVTASPLRDVNRAIIGAVAVFQDITTLHEAQASASLAMARLQALQQVTDAAMAHLSREAVLRHVLDTITLVLQVDNAAILLLDEARQELWVYVARGPEEAVANQVRVPLGEGIAGRVAARSEALIVDDMAQIETVNPFLRQHIRSLMGVPLRVNSRLLGVLHVGTLAPRRFTTADLDWLKLAADRIALAIAHADLYEAEQVARQQATAQAGELAAIMAAISDTILVYDHEGRLRYANAGAYAPNRHIGQSGYVGQSFVEQMNLTFPRDAEGHPLQPEEMPVARILQGEQFAGSEAIDVLIRLPSGEDALLRVTGAPLRDTQGAVSGAVVVAREMTRQWQMERRTAQALQALLAMAQLFVQAPEEETTPAPGEGAASALAQRLIVLTREVLGSTRVGLVSIDPETGVQRPLAVAGLSPELERLWWNLTEHPPEPQPEPDPALLARFMAGEALVIDMTQPPLRDQPNPFGIRTVLVAPLRVAGTVIGSLSLDYGGNEHEYTLEEIALAGAVAQLAALVIERDRLLHERTEAQANALALREVNRRMEEFLSIATHELRSPLTSMHGNLQLIARRLQRALAQPEADASHYLATLSSLQQLVQQATTQTARLGRMMADLLDVARIQSDHLELHMEAFDLVDPVRRWVDEVRLGRPARTITLEVSDAPVTVEADVDRIGQVTTNYLTNALKYSAPDTTVVVSVQTVADEARVEVRDQGPGLSLEQQAAIWERYQRVQGVPVQDDPRSSGGGLGLGLYISRMIIMRHGGEVGVKSAPGQGSTFWFTLPRSH